MDCASGVIGWLAANMVVLNYTHLHAFTRFYTKFLGGNVTAADGGQRILPALPSEAGVCSPEHGRRRAGVIPEVGKGGQKVGKWTGFSHLETALTRLFPGDST